MAVSRVEVAALQRKLSHAANVLFRVALPVRRRDRPRQLDLRSLHVHAVWISGYPPRSFGQIPRKSYHTHVTWL